MSILVAGRVAERLLTCAFGGLSLLAGWNLFRVGVVDPQAAELSMKDWKVKLQRVGPGVFFALFGSVVLVTGLNRSLSGNTAAERSPQQGPSPVQQTTPGRAFSYYRDSDPKTLAHLVHSLNTIVQFVRPDRTAPLSNVGARAVESAKTELTAYRNAILAQQFGQGAVDVYNKKIDAFLTNPQSVSAEDRATIATLQPWMEDTLISEAAK